MLFRIALPNAPAILSILKEGTWKVIPFAQTKIRENTGRPENAE